MANDQIMSQRNKNNSRPANNVRMKKITSESEWEIVSEWQIDKNNSQQNKSRPGNNVSRMKKNQIQTEK
jgi:hypothetical protein